MGVKIFFLLIGHEGVFGWRKEIGRKEGSWEERSWVKRNRIDLYFLLVCLDERKMRGKENGRKMIFPYLFMWKSERKEKDNAAKWQFYHYVVIKSISTILINIK